MNRHAVIAIAALAACAVVAVPARANRSQSLAEGPVKALPPGDAFVSVIALPQPPGASLTHGHVPGFVYGLDGTATIVDVDGSEHDVVPGEGYFIGALAVHTHKNADDRLQAGLLAIGLVVGVIALLVAVRSRRARPVLVPALLVALIAGGAVAFWNPWQNDWFFIGIRPEAARGGPMPIPSATRTYESPTFANVPPGPYVETLTSETVDAQGRLAESSAPGPVVFLVLAGEADVRVDNRAPVRLGHHDAALIQAGESARVTNPNDSEVHLLRFALAPQQS